MKKRNCYITTVLLILICVLTGCGKTGGGGSDTSAAGSEKLSKGEWIGLLGDQFGYIDYETTDDYYSDVTSDYEYYDEIQACAEWEVLTEEKELHPEDTATWQYAIETSVRAIGIDKINKSDAGVEVNEDNLIDFFDEKIANIKAGDNGDSVLSAQLTTTDASLILKYAYDYVNNLTLPQKLEYTYNEAVKEASEQDIQLDSNSNTGTIQAGSYAEGDVIYVEATENAPASAIRINSIENNEFTYESVGMEDVYEELQVSGTFEGTVIDIEPAEGVTISMVEEPMKKNFSYASYSRPEQSMIATEGKTESNIAAPVAGSGSNNVKFTATLGSGATFTVRLSDILVTSDVDYGILKGLKKAEANVSFNDKVELKYASSEHYSVTQNLGTVKVQLGTTPLTVNFSLIANVGMDGKITLTYASQVVANVNYVQGRGLAKSVNNNNANCDLHAEVTLTAEPTIKVELACVGKGIANVKVTSGVVAIAQVDIDLLGDEPSCVDLYMYVPLRWAVNEDGCIMTNISPKLKASENVWTSENSPITQRFHWEDDVLVEACTRGSKKAVEAKDVDENGEPYDEYELFEFEEISFETIKVEKQVIKLAAGESATITVVSVPGEYSQSDLTYSSENTSVCTVSGSQVTATGAGSTQIEVSTADGKYKTYVSVTVDEEYNDTSGFVPLA